MNFFLNDIALMSLCVYNVFLGRRVCLVCGTNLFLFVGVSQGEMNELNPAIVTQLFLVGQIHMAMGKTSCFLLSSQKWSLRKALEHQSKRP